MAEYKTVNVDPMTKDLIDLCTFNEKINKGKFISELVQEFYQKRKAYYESIQQDYSQVCGS